MRFRMAFDVIVNMLKSSTKIWNLYRIIKSRKQMPFEMTEGAEREMGIE